MNVVNVNLTLSLDTVNLVLMGLQHISQATIADIQNQAKASIDAQNLKAEAGPATRKRRTQAEIAADAAGGQAVGQVNGAASSTVGDPAADQMLS